MGPKVLEGGLTTKMKNIVTKKKKKNFDPRGPGLPPRSIPAIKVVSKFY